jgi:hypothetical protein
MVPMRFGARAPYLVVLWRRKRITVKARGDHALHLWILLFVPVVPDRLDRAAFEGLHAKRDIFLG